MFRFIFLILLLWSSSMYADDSFPAPFGLTWGASESSLKSLGFSRALDDNDFVFMSSVSAPKAWSMADNYVVVLYNDKLVKALGTSVDFKNDLYGSEGKAAFDQIKTLLTKKYGKPSSIYERSGLKLYKEADEFYQCLNYSGCGNYLALYNFKGGTVGLQLLSRGRRGVGYITIGYESPDFSKTKAAIEKNNLNKDADAF